jgi:hypothetical protein
VPDPDIIGLVVRTRLSREMTSWWRLAGGLRSTKTVEQLDLQALHRVRRLHHNVLAIALANKLARIAWQC